MSSRSIRFDPHGKPATGTRAHQVPGQYFRRQLNEFEGIIPNPTHRQNINHLRRLLSQPKKACGFKFKFDIQIACFQEIVDELHWISRDLRVVLLTRSNYLKQAVSRQNMERLLKVERNANLHSKLDLPPLDLDIDRAVRYARYMKSDDQRFIKSAAQFHNVKTLIYEDLLSDPAAIIDDLLEFLNVEKNHELTASIHKATPNLLSQAINNYEELVSAVTSTEFESMLD